MSNPIFSLRRDSNIRFLTPYLLPVDWLWDELEVISKYGKRYSDHWRPTTAERLAEGDATSVGNSGPMVD